MKENTSQERPMGNICQCIAINANQVVAKPEATSGMIKALPFIMVLSSALLFFLVITGVTARRSDFISTITPHSLTSWGGWGEEDMCPYGHYVDGFTLKIEGYQGGGDDTALNGIKLRCRSFCHYIGGNITSSVMSFGIWDTYKYCPRNSFFTAVIMRSEPPQNGGDDTATNNFLFQCRSIHHPYKVNILVGAGSGWGYWTGWSHCPKNTYICGIRTRVERYQGGGDDTALNGATFYCCKMVQLRKCTGELISSR